ncbi:alanine--tRNA ligase [Sulfuriroseicoccus oceanibius]|uniref:Alanine--tRNA ligase n=1 Tax=Sulfuriroseicoccus oceanibius TaxID=2707525 RepID=A0A6B3LH00_9BACT|nr:alanine--tRNA ligase [Sulfuriroseicoccus oceanibius]QQL45485.1 alanine--tRNA ligase [Sulfuriroseicoccus oceanibius]
MSTSSQIRQSFLDFFKEKQHTIVPSASLMPQSPGLLFTNAGMNQFVPYFLGTDKPDFSPGRATDTQKCIRAGGKHNDLDDVGYDTYHHTFFEMLGNWSFGDYFKAEAIAWAWELIVERWGFPAERLYATVYRPNKDANDPGEFDQEAYDIWAKLFESKGLDPKVHVVDGNVKDNFWMMGETGPCGPCSELHFDLTPNGDTKGALVNQDSDQCIEIWNLVFIQFNAEADGSFRELPARHVDTGMGFERVVSMIQRTKNFTDFSQRVSNYATDVFAPIFAKLEELSGNKYEDIYPAPGSNPDSHDDALKKAIAFRVVADHIRTLSFSIADGILPGNNGRNYVLRRILRRAVRYGRTLGFTGDKPFLSELVPVLVAEMKSVFPEIETRSKAVIETLDREETSFNETLDRGLAMFEKAATETDSTFPGDVAFKLYDTFGFPIDLTQLLSAERGLKVDMDTFNQLMEHQRDLGRAARSSELVRAAEIATDAVTEFVGFDQDTTTATVTEIHQQDDHCFVITDKTPFFVEMGGQHGDQGTLTKNGTEIAVDFVQQLGQARAHAVAADADLAVGDEVTLAIDPARRRPIEAHHSATHLLHWALHKAVSSDATQQGSLVTRNRLRFDFNSSALTPEQITEIEKLVNGAIESGHSVSWKEVPHTEVQKRDDIMQFFGDKYGDVVRVVQIGGEAQALNGYSMELCGGTHVTNTKDIGLFKIKSEGAISAGVRRIEALCGDAAWSWIQGQLDENTKEERVLRDKVEAINEQLTALEQDTFAVKDFPHIMGGLLVESGFDNINAAFNASLEHLDKLRHTAIEAEKALKKAQVGAAAKQADATISELVEKGGNIVLATEGTPQLLQELLNGLKKRQFGGAGFLIVDDGDKLHLGAFCGDQALAAGHKAGDLIRNLAATAGGKGGGKPDQARGAAPQREKLDELTAAAKEALA